ncbi:MAG: type II toxin-antitoxin system prevent-host-death family antitoxin [Propionibacteriaceae bacterium]|jgi:prevent-host-death family protein|nr:type II toxin-antitoxin system prevent-host-death family antitoxin [Propionibacteriaceae bacterium]
MTTVNIHEAKTHFSRLLAKVERGEEVVIARFGRPIAQITAIGAAPSREKTRSSASFTGAPDGPTVHYRSFPRERLVRLLSEGQMDPQARHDIDAMPGVFVERG